MIPKRLAMFALAPLLTMCSPQCAPTQPMGRGSAPWVAVGDSIMYSAGRCLTAQLPTGGVVYANIAASIDNAGWGDTSIIDGVREHAHEVAPGGHLIIQDDGSWSTYASEASFVQSVGASLPTDITVVWVLPYSPFARDRDAAVSQAILDNRLPTSRVADWAETAMSSTTELIADMVHPNDEGCVALASTIGGVW